jgi:hypothetical protein
MTDCGNSKEHSIGKTYSTAHFTDSSAKIAKLIPKLKWGHTEKQNDYFYSTFFVSELK